MLVIHVTAHGGPEVLQATEVPTPEPGPGQIRIRHKAVGVNFIDTYHRTGLYPLTLPAVLGQEAAGVVEAIGPGVDRFRVGDRAAYAMVFGGYAEANIVPAGRAVHLPETVSFETAAAAMLKGMTAEFLLRRCYPVKAGDAILVHAAAGGVGGLLTQWAKALGATVIGTVGSAAKLQTARRQGCDEVILYMDEDVPARVAAVTAGRRVQAVYDGVGAATLEASLSSLARRGVLISFGNASGAPGPVEPIRLMRGGSLFLTRPTLGDYVATTEELDASAAALFHVIEGGTVEAPIGQTFPLAEARRAHEALESRRTTGATLLIP